MAFDFDVVGWEDFDGDRHDGKPSDLDDTYGVKVYAEDEETGQVEAFWAFVVSPFEDWTEWLDYIGTLMSMYGLELA